MSCKGICDNYKSISGKITNNERYIIGQKYCSQCEIFTKWDGVRCPCCSFMLRTKPRNKKAKQRLKIKLEIRV